jgi:hypothetical protein
MCGNVPEREWRREDLLRAAPPCQSGKSEQRSARDRPVCRLGNGAHRRVVVLDEVANRGCGNRPRHNRRNIGHRKPAHRESLQSWSGQRGTLINRRWRVRPCVGARARGGTPATHYITGNARGNPIRRGPCPAARGFHHLYFVADGQAELIVARIPQDHRRVYVTHRQRRCGRASCDCRSVPAAELSRKPSARQRALEVQAGCTRQTGQDEAREQKNQKSFHRLRFPHSACRLRCFRSRCWARPANCGPGSSAAVDTPPFKGSVEAIRSRMVAAEAGLTWLATDSLAPAGASRLMLVNRSKDNAPRFTVPLLLASSSSIASAKYVLEFVPSSLIHTLYSPRVVSIPPAIIVSAAAIPHASVAIAKRRNVHRNRPKEPFTSSSLGRG